MSYYIDIQNATTEPLPINEEELTRLALLTLNDYKKEAELTIRLVTPEEMIQLNHIYRQQNKTTNVLAFPYTPPPEIPLDYFFLGDVVICPQVLLTESQQLNKSLESHWALIVIHGILHLLGYDHIKDDDATMMQSIEIQLLTELGFSNPYDIEGNQLE